MVTIAFSSEVDFPSYMFDRYAQVDETVKPSAEESDEESRMGEGRKRRLEEFWEDIEQPDDTADLATVPQEP